MPDSASVRRNPDVDYERSDLSLRVIAIVAIGLVVLLGITPLIILGAFPKSRGDVERRLTIQPPAPRLQTDPPADLANYMKKEQQLLGSYGWVDRARGIARVPIGIEMQRLARAGIPGFPQAPAPEAPAQPRPGDAFAPPRPASEPGTFRDRGQVGRPGQPEPPR